MSYPPSSSKTPQPSFNLALDQGDETAQKYSPAADCLQLTQRFPAPITNQPNASPAEENCMPITKEIYVCPPGLEYLSMIDQLLVHQRSEFLGGICTCETKNKYTIKNSLGQTVYTTREDTTWCSRHCCGRFRPFDLKIRNNYMDELIHLTRKFRCSSCFCPCFLQRLEVMSPPGTLIGTVVQEWSPLTPKFRVKNESGETVLKIEGPFCTYSICGNVEFKVLSTSNVKVGKITKQWSGLDNEIFTDYDNFGISFPVDLDGKMKAVLLGALFLIDYMYFESSRDDEECNCTHEIITCCSISES